MCLRFLLPDNPHTPSSAVKDKVILTYSSHMAAKRHIIDCEKYNYSVVHL